ncbi:hypothetical protein GGH91_003896 [Coemansia sp. RSA 2671]|uniref:Uncharacterized protein n=2 Tax=Coemansia TaxID=4863 RepID=A0A9W8L409_9FUNG|nr:hypothetical protein IWW57_003786 [Coemansia sp. S610]KAJ2341324.1 hypothetical protein GGH91_003896 [Coemansia sp. RSA 2671]KAJ2413239.1 hypothetical protein GGI10_003187 [Coemansia sp. RSA 2530]KAJ2688753.1 hypothetical protein IWW39_001968 [Coemansia spiralis]KAJ2697372.1 hypothetical protein H4218_004011 [Coemansia sp. IMI 209128]KAJ2792793.1 hypothetical protein GGI18_000093 [Coemansia linderi]
MKLAAAATLFATAVIGAQTSASVEPSQACVKACQVAPEDQRETCMRVCGQFAEQGINFAPASATTHSSVVKQTAPALASSPAKTNSAMSKPTESPATSSGASSMASGSMSTAKSQGEESADEHSSVSGKSMSAANSGPHTVGARLGASALVLAAVALF